MAPFANFCGLVPPAGRSLSAYGLAALSPVDHCNRLYHAHYPSTRSASVGSTRSARIIGTMHANRQTANMNAA